MAHVVVIDDDEATLKLYAAVIKRVHGETPLAFSDPQAALQSLENMRPSLIIVDYFMPEMDGVTFTKALRAMSGHASTPILMLTAHSELSLGPRAIAAGATTFLEKPISLKEFTAQLRRFTNPPGSRTTHGEVAVTTDERDTIERLHRTIRCCDPALAASAVFVRDIAGAIGEQLELPPGQLEALRAAALVYDIGMLSVPERVREAPVELSPRWRSFVNAHVDAGAAILDGSRQTLLQVAATIARTHHERFDGSGYPDGLAGDEIPLLARIIAVADTYGALVSDRPYRIETTHAHALAQIRAGRGRAFDPVVVDALVRLESRLSELHHSA
ncbi:MAG TPA: HD domain-containing phosphohydrolase [Candidatus Aquilonibacter sp.]